MITTLLTVGLFLIVLVFAVYVLVWLVGIVYGLLYLRRVGRSHDRAKRGQR